MACAILGMVCALLILYSLSIGPVVYWLRIGHIPLTAQNVVPMNAFYRPLYRFVNTAPQLRMMFDRYLSYWEKRADDDERPFAERVRLP